MNIHNINQNDQITWEVLIEALSTDCSVSFWDEMGLSFLDISISQPIFRKFVNLSEAKSTQIEMNTKLIFNVFNEISQSIGNNASEKLITWEKNIMSDTRQYGSFHWTTMLCWLAGINNRKRQVIYPDFSQEKISNLSSIINKNFNDLLTLDRKIEEAEVMPKSEWDKKIYKKSEENYSPLITVSNIIVDYRFFQTWKSIKTLLSDNDIKKLLQWAKDNSHILQINPENIKLPF